MLGKHIVIFDGVCNFCNSSVNFIIKRDNNNVFVFTPIQSEFGKSLVAKYEIPTLGMDTFVLIINEKYFLRTDAALEITKYLSGYWYLFSGFKVLPKPVRDYFYSLIAKNRYKLFGRKDVCMVPTRDLRDKFILDEPE